MITTVALFTTLGIAAQQAPAGTPDSAAGIEASAKPARAWTLGDNNVEAPAVFADDDVPLPIPAVVEPSSAGDHVIQPASGDPNFLGFAAGPYFPPQGERIDPDLLAHAQTSYADGRPSAETYAFVMFSKRMTPARLTQLESLGCRVLGLHPHYTQKIALPATAIDEIAALDFVRWLGTPKSWQKVHPRLIEEFAKLPDGKSMEVYIDVYDADLGAQSSFVNVGVPQEASPDAGIVEGQFDERTGQVWQSNGWQQHALERLGVDVLEYVDSIRAFRARIAPSQLEQLAAQDFIQFVEPNLPDQLSHDESMPMVNADWSRIVFDGSWNGNVMAGVIDSGLQIFHEALIPHIYIGWDVTPEGWAYSDGCTHGSHVAGTFFGAPPVAHASYTGMAPGLGYSPARRIRILKFFDANCVSAGVSHSTLYSYMHSNYSDGTNISPPPQAINCSWGSSGSVSSPWIGSEANPRTLDAEVYSTGQMYVFAAGNDGPGASTLTSPAVAKNALTVGSVNDYYDFVDGDPGNVSSFSSRGPCGDGRWKPNVVAPGANIRSVATVNNTGYINKSGTSMATPHVAGFAAMMCDSDSYLHYKPHLIANLMMSTALTHNDVVLTTPGDSHLRNYGAGMINTQTPMYGATNLSCLGYQFTQGSGSYQYGDYTVYSGCKRLVAVMTYHEGASSSGASKALVNNFDMYLDSDFNGISAAGNSGDFFAQQSSLDNTEIRIIDNPYVGTWRWKIWPTSTSSSVKMSIGFTAIYANTKPNGTLSLYSPDTYVQPGDVVSITATAYNPEYFASNVFVDSTSSAQMVSSSTTLFDGSTPTNLFGNVQGGYDVLLGMIGPNYSRSVNWGVYWNAEGVQNFQVAARSDNWVDHSSSIQITVDGTAPSGPTNFTSSTHAVGVPNCSTTVQFAWTAATDSLAGLDKYIGLIDQSPSAAPTSSTPGILNLPGGTTTWGASVAPSAGNYYAHLRALDRSGNLGTTKHYGPFKVIAIDVSSYCTGKINSQFCVPSIGSTGTPQISANNFTVTCANVLNNKNGLLFWGRTPQATPFQGAYLCVQSPLQRTSSIPSGGTPSGNNCTGTYAFTFTQAYINSVGLHAGDDVYCQWWMRDPAVATTTGLSNALRFVLCQ